MENVENLFSNLMTIWNIAGAKMAFLGYTDPLVPIRQSQITAKVIYTPEDNLQHYVDVLRNQEQCSYIIIIASWFVTNSVGKQTRM
jgi:hypothetical protein